MCDELDGARHMEVRIIDVEGRGYIYWVDTGDLEHSGEAYDFALEQAVPFHQRSNETEIARSETGDLETWACEPFTRYEGEVILVPPSSAAS